MRRLTLTQHTVRCPLDDCAASLTLRTNPNGHPSRRYLDVAACSRLPSPSFVPPATSRYFFDVGPAVPYLCEADPAPCHSLKVSCAKPCLAALNAAEPGAAEPVRCTSGLHDGMELVRQTQSPAITRLLWFYSV
jgi:hypothetical protein